MTLKEVTITSTKPCSQCYKKMHHGHKAIALINKRDKVKAYCCSDTCAQTLLQEKA